jgi:EAL domain-containing protein (putative c-di-GMP-specific phosphodiesterase class I)
MSEPGEAGRAAGAAQLPRYAIAFQPIVDVARRRILAHEALLRGSVGTPAGGVLARVPEPERQRFEIGAIAAVLDAFAGTAPSASLHINLSPEVLLRWPGTVPELARVVAASDIPPGRVVIEVAEGERIGDADALVSAFAALRSEGLRTALDAFGTGYGGIGLLASVRPDLVKLDMGLARNVHLHPARRPILSRLLEACADLNVDVVATGVENEGEYRCLARLGVTLFQGFLFAPPATGRVLDADEVSLPPEPAPPGFTDPWQREQSGRLL